MKKPQELIVRFGARLTAQRSSGTFKAWEECLFQEQLSLRLREILGDLGLSACELAVRLVGSEEQPSRFLFGLELEGVVCHGPLDNGPDGRVNLEQLVGTVAATLIAHRDMLLVGVVRDGVWERTLRQKDTQDWIPRPAFDDLVAAAIRHGLDVPRAVDAFAALFKGGMHTDQLSDQVEAIVATQSEPFIRVRVGSMGGLEESKLNRDVRDKLFSETGLLFPPCKVVLDGNLPATELCLELNRLRIIAGDFDEARPAEALAKLLRHYGPVYTTTTAVDSALGQFAEAFPMLVFNVIEAFGTGSVLRILRSLVDEGVDIRDLRTILGAMLEASGPLPARYERLAVFLPYEATLPPELGREQVNVESKRYVECIRNQLRDQICQASADSDRVLRTVRLTETVETRLSNLDQDPFSEDELFELLSAIARVVETGRRGVVLLVSRRNRRRFWELIRHVFPRLPVLCEADISPYVQCDDVGELLPQPSKGRSSRRRGVAARVNASTG